MKRRALFGFLGVSPVAVVSAAVAAQAAKDDAPYGAPLLTLMPSKPREPDIRPGQIHYWGQHNDESRALGINVGADGNLWVKPKGKPWQRVVTA